MKNRTETKAVKYSDGSYKLELRTISNNKSNDNKLETVLAEGFIIYRNWLINHNSNIPKDEYFNLRITLRNPEMFQNYYIEKWKSFNEVHKHDDNRDLIIDPEFQFIKEHIKDEQDHYNNILKSDEIKKVIGSELDKYLESFENYLKFLNNSLTNDKQSDESLKPFNPEKKLLEEWISPMYFSKYIEIEKELFSKSYIDAEGKWIKSYGSLKNLVEFAFLIIEFDFFRPIVKGNRKQKFHYKQFISERYLNNKKALSGIWKKYYKEFSIHNNSFDWIKRPD